MRNKLMPSSPPTNSPMSPSGDSRQITYAEAINEATRQAMALDPQVVVMGQLADTPAGIFGTTTGLAEKFGRQRVMDFQVAEHAMTMAAMGASLTGIRPVVVHQRLDFMIYSLDAIVNWLSLWYFKSDQKSCMPVTIRAVVGKGWGQGPQHAKSLHAWFSHLPGLRVAVPATAFDAKGLLLESIFSQIPTILIEGRSLFSMKDTVPEKPYRISFGKGAFRSRGKDCTLVCLGMMVPLACRVAETLSQQGVSVEVIDLRTISPWDEEMVSDSVRHTGRLAVMDPGWQSFGCSAEIISRISERNHRDLRSAPLRLAFPDSHVPMSQALEDCFYPSEEKIVRHIKDWLA